jgi:pimeloyl-ACP methyl ester carboxylesterase
MKPWKRNLAILVGILLLILLIGPLIIPIPPLEDTLPPKELAGPDSQFLEIDGIEAHYQSAGEGEPTFILLHSFAASLFSWREVWEPLSQIDRVIAYDRPAFGLTERPMPEDWGEVNPYTIESQTQLLIHLMDELGVEKAILVGNSAGGTQALYTYLHHPERVQALILVDPAIYVGGGAPGWSKFLLETPQMRRIGPWLIRSIATWGESAIDLAWHDPSLVTPEIIEGYRLPLRAENWDRALWEFTLASRELNLETRLDEIQVPTLVITGDDDRIVPTEDSIRLAGDIPGAELAILPNCGHLPQEECPEPFLEAVQGFIQSIEQERHSEILKPSHPR